MMHAKHILPIPFVTLAQNVFGTLTGKHVLMTGVLITKQIQTAMPKPNAYGMNQQSVPQMLAHSQILHQNVH